MIQPVYIHVDCCYGLRSQIASWWRQLLQYVPKTLPEICHDRHAAGRVSCWSFAGNWFGMKPRLHGLARLYYREKVQHVDTYSCKNLYLDPPRVLNFSPTRSVVGVFFWRTNFTPDWRIWVYKHLSWSSWLASLFGPRCTVFFVIYERLLRILVEADQILRFLSVILFNIHTPLTYPHSIHGTP